LFLSVTNKGSANAWVD